MALAVSTLLASTAAFVAIAYFLYYHMRRMRLYTKSSKFPGPWALPVIGNALSFIGNTEDILGNCMNLLDNYPSPFRVWLADRLFYVIYEPEQLKIVMNSQKAIEKEELYKFAEPWLGTGLFTAPAAKWRVHRKLIAPTFNQRILDSFVEVFAEQSNIMAKELEIEVDGGEFDVFNYVSLCTLDIICETAMGVPSKAQTERDSPYVESAKKLFEAIFTRMFQVWLHPDFIFYRTKLGKEMMECVEYVHGLTNTVIQTKKQTLMSKENKAESEISLPGNETKRKAFLDLLMELTNEGTKFTDEELREEVDTMMIAGNDTTASVNTFTILMMASHPEIQEKVYQEMYEIYGGEDPEVAPVRVEDLARMDYLERVIKESMRLFPVGPLLVRKVTDDLNIGKYTLTKGASVVLGIMKVHRSEKYWKDPLIFNPDRFLPEQSVDRHPYSFVPFSGGPRNCLGTKYAMMAMKALLGTLVRKYVLKKDVITPVKDIRLKADVVLKPVIPISVRIERRTHGKDHNS